MSDISVLIQGPLNETSLKTVEYYSTIGPVVICHWNTDDVTILNQYNLTDSVVVRYPEPIPPFLYKADTFMFQVCSLAYGFRNVDTPYVIRTRSDESFGNLQPLIDQFNQDTSKIICGNIFFRKWAIHPCHIGDHLYIGNTKIFHEVYEKLRNFPEKYKDKGHPEQIVARVIIEMMNPENEKKTPPSLEVDMFKEIFDVIDINKLKPFLARWAHCNKNYENEFVQNGTITNMKELI